MDLKNLFSQPEQFDSSTRSAQPSAVFSVSASEPCQEPDTRSPEHVFGAQQNAPGGRIVRTIGIVRARANRLAERGLQHSPPADAGTARRGIKTVESSAMFQPKQWAEKASREDNRKQDPARTCAQSSVKIEHCSWRPIVGPT